MKNLRFFKSLLVLIGVLIVGINQVNAETRRIYCKCAQSWWYADGAACGAYYWGSSSLSAATWPGVKMTETSSGSRVWYIDIDDSYTNVIFTRLNPSNSKYWSAKTGDLTISSSYNYYTISSTSGVWDPSTVSGSWSNKTYTITYKDKGNADYSGSNSGSFTTSQKWGYALELIEGEKDGYVFNGWYTNSSCTGAAITSLGISVNSNQTLYAKWTAETTYTITIANNINATTSTKSIGATPKQITAPDIADYAFSTWSTMPSGVTKTSGNLTDESIYVSATKAATVTANFNLIPVKLWTADEAKFASGSKDHEYTMSYDATEGAYYYQVTTDASPYYFRFWYNGETEYSCAWGSDGLLEVVANGSKQDAATDVTEYGTHTTLKYVGESGTTIKIWFDKQNGKTWITADKDKEYVLRGAFADNDSQADGMPGWGATTSYFEGLASGNTGTISCTLNANEWYHLKAYNVYTKTWWGPSSDTGLSDGTLSSVTSGGSGNFYFQTTVAGSYTFTLDKSSGTKLKVDYPVSYTVNFGVTPAAAADAPTNNLSISSGSLVASGTSITFTKDATPNSGYTWSHWEKNSSNVGSNNTYTTSITANTTVNAVYTEDMHTVTVTADSHGSVTTPASGTPRTVSAGIATGASIAASANTGYTFYNWTKTSGSGTVTFANANANSTTVKATSDATVRANFVDMWNVKGSWDSWAAYEPMTATGVSNTYSATKTLAAKTEYHIKVVKRVDNNSSNDKWYGVNGGTTLSRATGSVTGLEENGGETEYITFTTDAAGDYTITYLYNASVGSMKVTVGYPTAYTITYGVGTINGSSTAVSVSPSFTSGDYVLPETDVTFSKGSTKAGYTWKGWYGNVGGTGDAWSTTDASLSLTATRTGNISVYACYNYATYTATLSTTDRTGYGSGAPANQTATYLQAMPTITPPTATNGYCFMGYWDGEEGTGTQYYNANGTSAHAWDKTSGATLYAYFKKAEITAITFDNAVVESNGTVSFAVTVSPTPVGDTKLCFTVLHSNDNPLDDQPTITYNGVTGKYSFTASATSGMYKVQAVLRTGSTCDGGTELDTEVASFQVAGLHTVTVRYKCGDDVIKAATTTTGRPLDWSDEITAPEIVGYSFTGWEAGDGVTLTDDNGVSTKTTTTEATIKIKAIYDGYLTANYTKKRVIYFYNTLNWENVYVYFYKNDSYWGPSNQGTGANTGWQFTGYPYSEGKHGQMLPVYEGSKIYYFDAEEAGVNASYTNVAFTELDQHGCDYFYNNNKVVRRGDYHATTMPLFVPLSDQPEVKKNSNAASYYCEGYWMNYPANSGYTLRIYDTWDADNVTGASREFLIPFSEDVKMPLKQDVEINFSGKSWFIIYRNDGNYLEGSHTFKQTDHGDKKITSNANASKAKKMTLISDGSGIYTFTLSFYGDGGSPENYDYYINVDFPAAVGDYRIVYKDNATWTHGAHGNNYATWYHPSDIIGKNNSATETKEDTVSFFVSHGSSPAMKFQKIDAIAADGTVTWTDVPSGSITIPASITKSGVYNFIVSQPAGGASISLEKAEPYTGNYYIRTDCAGETKWNNFRSHDHLMNYSEYSITHGGYSHYYTHWVQTGDKPNIKFCIANEYSSAISDTLTRETAEGAWANIGEFITEGGNIRRNANVRFMWNQSTNVISRAYVDGAQAEGTRFLVISSTDGKVTQADGSALSNNEVTFSDTENWIYEAYVKAQPTSQFKLVSTWGTGTVITQYFKGSSSTTETLIDGSGTDWYDIRLLYDFKTNRLVAAWVPSDANIVVDNPINADVMFIREHQGDIAQLTFGASGKISKIETAYGVMRFSKWTLANKEKTGGHSPLGSPASIYERSLFWISFPFRVKLSEVFGFGTYGEHWAIQRYDGADRAARGHFLENGSFWRWMNRSTEYLEPNQGYLLAIDLDLLGESSSVWGPNSISDRIELYFPSYGTMPDITNASVTQTIPPHECTINRAATEGLPDTGDPRTSYNRTIFDSHWNVLSVPTYVNTTSVSFANTTWTAAGKRGPKFLYTWNADDNTITATTASGYTYHAMHSYMAQYAGDITWTASSGSPASIVARKTYEEQPSEVEFRLELQQNEKMIDRTFVILSNDEEVSADFQFGEDMTKEFNASKASIYTFIPNIAAVAGNTLPMSEQTTVIPVGVQIKANGDYTFSMPDGTSGIGVSLIDNETGIRTNLGLTDYTVTLTAGTYDQRFMLEIPPVSNMPTDIEEVTGDGLQVTGVRKVLIDNKLFIIKDGEVYDARGAKVK